VRLLIFALGGGTTIIYSIGRHIFCILYTIYSLQILVKQKQPPFSLSLEEFKFCRVFSRALSLSLPIRIFAPFLGGFDVGF